MARVTTASTIPRSAQVGALVDSVLNISFSCPDGPSSCLMSGFHLSTFHPFLRTKHFFCARIRFTMRVPFS